MSGNKGEPLLAEVSSAAKAARRVVARALRPICVIITIIVVAVVLIGILGILGTIAFIATHPKGAFENENITTVNLFVTNFQGTTGTFLDLIATTFQSTSATITNLITTTFQSVNGTIGDLITTTFQSATATITNLTATIFQATTGTITNLFTTTFQGVNGTFVNLITNTFQSVSGTITNLFSTSITTDNLALKMQSFAVYNHAINGTVVSSHNLQTISGASVVNVSFPASLASLVGKEIEICNADGKRHLIDTTPAGVRWDTRNFWRVIQFDANSRGCCVTFVVLSSTTISLVSRGERCSTFCAESNLYHCVDPERPELTNPFHALWEKETNGNGFRTIPYLRIDMTIVPARVTFYRGNVKNPRERIALDAGTGFNAFAAAPNVIGQSPVPNFATGGATWLMMQTGNTRITYSLGYTDVDFFGWDQAAGSYIKAVEDNIVPSTTVLHHGLDPNHPEAILRNLYDNQVYMDLPFLSKSAAPFDGFIGHPAASAHLETLIDTGFAYTTPISTIFVSQTVELFTILRTDEYHHVSPTGIVTISGCTGSWAALNGVHVVTHILGTNQPLTDPLFVDYGPVPANRTQHHEVAILFDTRNATIFTRDASGVGNATGPCVMDATYGPITGATEYRPTMAAVWNLHYEAFRSLANFWPHIYHSPTTHGTPLYGNPFVRPSETTWANVVSRVAANIGILTRMDSIRINGVASAYLNPALRYRTRDLYNGAGPTFFVRQWIHTAIPYNLNNRFGVRFDADRANFTGTYYYDIARKNYLEQVKVPYWRCNPSGNIKTGPLNTMYGSSAFFNTSDGKCDYFQATLRDYDDAPPVGYTTFNSEITFNLNLAALPAIEQDRLKADLWVGMINTTMTGGARIGYIRMYSLFQADPLSGFFDKAFVPPGQPNTARDTREAYAYLFKDLMHYLVTTLQVESIIIDQRGTGAGRFAPTLDLRSFFGAGNVRPLNFQRHSLSASAGFVAPLDLATLQYPFDVVATSIKAETSFVDSSIANYPSSMFLGERVYIMTSQEAAYSQFTLNYWLGQNLNGDLGNGVTAKIVGDMFGRIQGSGASNFVPVGTNNARIRTGAGAIVTPFLYNTSTTFAAQRPDGSWISNLHPSMQIACTTLPGKSGGCPMPNDEETLLFPDLGFLPNTRPQLPGDPRDAQPITNVRSTWRDAWLEATVQQELNEISARRRRDNIPKSKKMPKSDPPRKRAVYDPQASYEMYGVDITCPEGVTLTPLSQMVPTIHIPIGGDDVERAQAIVQVTSIITEEYRNGGLCRRSEDGHIMFTPSCKAFPALVFA